MREKILIYKFTDSQEWEIPDWDGEKREPQVTPTIEELPRRAVIMDAFILINLISLSLGSNVKCILIISRIWIPKVSPRQISGPVTKKTPDVIYQKIQPLLYMNFTKKKKRK